jgi:hypothetical protein
MNLINDKELFENQLSLGDIVFQEALIIGFIP